MFWQKVEDSLRIWRLPLKSSNDASQRTNALRSISTMLKTTGEYSATRRHCGCKHSSCSFLNFLSVDFAVTPEEGGYFIYLDGEEISNQNDVFSSGSQKSGFGGPCPTWWPTQTTHPSEQPTSYPTTHPSFTSSPTLPGQTVTIEFVMDDKPGDIGWTIEDGSTGEFIASHDVGTYSRLRVINGTSRAVERVHGLRFDNVYELRVNDDGCDGFPNGFVRVYLGDEVDDSMR